MKVAIYCRVSTVDMGQNVERQVLELREICQRNDWEIVGEYIDDGVSGTKKSRPQLDLMMKHARMRKFNKIVCLELSRIARSTKHMLDILEDLKGRNQHIFIVNQGIDTSNYMGEFFATVLTALAAVEVEQISERVKSGIANARKKNGGKWGRQKTKLTMQQKTDIKSLRAEKEYGILKLAKKFSVSTHTIYKILDA
jgi:DNA invertase Pin-like site-specific DNA recombinase